MKRLSVVLLAAVLVMGMVTACGDPKSTWTMLRTERGPWETIGPEIDCPNGTMLVSIERAVGKEQTFTADVQLGGSLKAKALKGIVDAEVEIASFKAQYKYSKVEITIVGGTRLAPIEAGQSIQYYYAMQCDVFCRNENEEDLLYQPIEGSKVSFAWVVTDRNGNIVEDTREEEKAEDSDTLLIGKWRLHTYGEDSNQALIISEYKEENAADGIGMVHWQDGMTYLGYFSGNRNGWGMNVDDKNIHMGTYENDRREGKGLYFDDDNGTLYVGGFANDKYSGSGIMVNVNDFEIIQQGVWINGEFYGTETNNKYAIDMGTNTDGTGWVYVGEMENSVSAGIGAIIWTDNNIYFGEWSNNNRSGKGVRLWENGTIYFGDYLDNERTGTGCYVDGNDGFYIGDYVGGIKTGEGIQFGSDGQLKVGIWKNGDLIEEETRYR